MSDFTIQNLPGIADLPTTIDKLPEVDESLPSAVLPTTIDVAALQRRNYSDGWTAKFQRDREEYEANKLAQQEAYDESVAKAKAQSEYDMRFMSDYNDTEVVNSVGDVFWNVAEDVVRDVMDALENPSVFSTAKLIATPNIAKVKYATGVAGVMKDTLLDPMMHAITSDKEDQATNWMTVGLNALQNLGETADIFANPFKAMIIGGEDGRFEAVKSSIGWGMEGRQNFDYDFSGLNLPKYPTLALEMTAEIFSDPATLITMGTSAVAKTAVRKTLMQSLEELPKKAAKKSAKKAAPKKKAKKSAKKVAKKSTKKAKKRK